MSILEITPVPAHRGQYPGELHLFVGGGGERGKKPAPANWAITVRHCSKASHAKHVKAAWPGPLELWTNRGDPVVINCQKPPAPDLGDLAALEKLTGVALGAELLGHFAEMVAGFDGSEYVIRHVRFTDLAMFNDFMVGLAVKAGAPLERATRARVLSDLLKDVSKHAGPQLDWYRDSGPGEHEAAFKAEHETFAALTAAYTAATARQMAA